MCAFCIQRLGSFVWSKMAPSERDKLVNAYSGEQSGEDVSCERLCEPPPPPPFTRTDDQ